MTKKTRTTGLYVKRERHGDSDVHDLVLLTRKPSMISMDKLAESWGGKKNEDLSNYIHRFISYNRRSLKFLSINVSFDEQNGHQCLILSPSEKVGSAPLYSPVNGKIASSFIVRGNMNEDVSEILPLISGNIELKFDDRLKLPFKTSIRPPLYFECAKFIDQYIIAKRSNWKKFVNENRIEKRPSASTKWDKYACASYDPRNTFRYPNQKNYLTTEHPEWKELNYVLTLCIKEFESVSTPRRSLSVYQGKIETLRNSISSSDIKQTKNLRIHAADPKEIKLLKEIGNNILNSVTIENRAWSLDFSKMFERYVQYVFSHAGSKAGVTVKDNYKLPVEGFTANWTLRNLEPDIIVSHANNIIIADAKYKMNLYNAGANNVEYMKESFRHDLHQLLAYSSFQIEPNKCAILAYPSSRYIEYKEKIKCGLSSTSITVYLIGIPWGECNTKDKNQVLSTEEKVKTAVDGVYKILSSLLK